MKTTQPIQEPRLASSLRWQATSIGLLFALVAAGLAAQARSQDDRYTDHVSVEWVSVPMVIEAGERARTRKANGPIPARWISVRVDGAEVPVDDVQLLATPLSLLYLQDTSGSMGLVRRLDRSRELLISILSGLGPDDEIAIVPFSARELPKAIDYLQPGAKPEPIDTEWRGFGRSAVLDAAGRIGTWLRMRRGHPAAILVTDGGENASTLDPATVRELLTGTGIPLYVIAIEPHSSYGDGRIPTVPQSLPELAAATGGRYLEVSLAAGKTAIDAAGRVRADLRQRVRVDFSTEAVGKRALREIDVEIREPHYTVHHRSHYFGYAPTGSAGSPSSSIDR